MILGVDENMEELELSYVAGVAEAGAIDLENCWIQYSEAKHMYAQ